MKYMYDVRLGINVVIDPLRLIEKKLFICNEHCLFLNHFPSISNRAQLAKEMHIEKLMKKNKVWINFSFIWFDLEDGFHMGCQNLCEPILLRRPEDLV